MNDPVELSIVVALISGRPEDLERCLLALRGQRDIDAPEVIVPYDEPCAGVLQLTARFPEVTFLPLVGVDTRQARAGASREHHDALRTLGLRHARGRFVILTEDHAHADPQWASSLLSLLARTPAAACVGGAVEWGGSTTLSYAVYLCDFGRYQNPLPEAQAKFVSDSNVCYRREWLEKVGEDWKNGYQETLVHGVFSRHGAELWLTPTAVVWQSRTGLTWRKALRERRVWGRSYAGSRVADAPSARRFVLAVLALALPLVLTWRLVAALVRKRKGFTRTLLSVPALLVLNGSWAVGELTGYLTGSPD